MYIRNFFYSKLLRERAAWGLLIVNPMYTHYGISKQPDQVGNSDYALQILHLP